MEVSPHLAYDGPGTLREARRLWQRLELPNALIKVPGTEAGVRRHPRSHCRRHQRERDAAVLPGTLSRRCAGLYRGPAAARRRRDTAHARSPRWQASSSAASTAPSTRCSTDSPRTASPRRARCGARRRSPAPVAPTRSTRRSLATPAWQQLAARGAQPQRLLWASTSTKDPSYSPIKYVEELVVPGTVNTMPLETLNTYRRLGRPELRLERHLAEAQRCA